MSIGRLRVRASGDRRVRSNCIAPGRLSIGLCGTLSYWRLRSGGRRRRRQTRLRCARGRVPRIGRRRNGWSRCGCGRIDHPRRRHELWGHSRCSRHQSRNGDEACGGSRGDRRIVDLIGSRIRHLRHLRHLRNDWLLRLWRSQLRDVGAALNTGETAHTGRRLRVGRTAATALVVGMIRMRSYRDASATNVSRGIAM